MSKISSIKGEIFIIKNDPYYRNSIYKTKIAGNCDISSLENENLGFEANHYTKICDIEELDDQIIYMDLSKSNFKCSDLNKFPILYKLKTLDISKRGRVPVFGLTFLDKFPNLEKIIMRETFTNPRQPFHCGDNPKLNEVILYESGIDIDTLKNILKNCPIKTIDFTESEITDETLKCFEGYNKLENLCFNNIPISNKGLSYLQDNTNMIDLQLKELKNIDDIGISVVENFKYLNSLDISYNNISNTGMYYLNCPETLKTFKAYDTKLISVDFLENYENIFSMELASNKLDDDGIACLGTCKSIKNLHLRFCKIEFGDVFRLLPQLECLSISFNPLHKSIIDNLLLCQNLKKLDIGCCYIPHTEILRLKYLSNLTSLDCTNYKYTKKMKKEIQKTFSNLQSLYV